MVRDYDRSLPRITAHGSQLNQVWTNLLDNAIDAVDGDGHDHHPHPPGAGRHRGRDRATTAPACPAELQSRLFEPFFTTKEVGKGTGLGLDIVRRIVRGHRGDITLSSRPGSTSFTVSLPLDDPAG